ncbi:hypothetical protein BS47DRAFT_1390524 [Hydnum rufescens UP504]|uniref:Phosphoenolpyruvate carboxykinase (ATP) n=1 Tax=Hydnum rufescens UP504 TaxID=1448309 RepID=A0A9P6B2X7_9AGAM|nr:hypothetical protein BS47DRAFT_1390524 [Hydnum rufescens UP504]
MPVKLQAESAGGCYAQLPYFHQIGITNTLEINRERAIDYLNTRDNVYVFDGFAGWDPKYRIKVRVVCARAYHALFMNNMLIRPTEEELAQFGEPDFVIYNAGQFPANRFTTGMTSTTSVEINFKRMEMVILGTEYAGEMKKGIFIVIHYLQPVKFGQLSLHSSANIGMEKGDVTLFFGLSGTGKTYVLLHHTSHAADPNRELTGDDEHVWSDTGVFNIEGGCYAKCINLSAEKEPEIYRAIRFGSILENVVFNPSNRLPDYNDVSTTENTRCAYPIEYIPNARIPCIADQPEQHHHAYVRCLSSHQKTSGTEDGVLEPIPTFSMCYSAPFIVLHPGRYASMLASKMEVTQASCWLINTGWVGGKFGTGSRCPLKYTRAIINAIHSGSIVSATYTTYDIFGLQSPTSMAWEDTEAFEKERIRLANMFAKAFKGFEDQVDSAVKSAGPTVTI